MEFPDTLKYLLKYHKTSIVKFAKDAGIPEMTVRTWMTKRTQPQFRYVKLICEYFHTTPNFLFGYDPLNTFDVLDMQDKLNQMTKDLEEMCDTIVYAQKQIQKVRGIVTS